MPSCSQGTCIYDPRNLQAHALTCHRISSHKAIPPEETEADDVETDSHATGIHAHVAAARRSLDSLDVVGLAEFFHETLCLLWLCSTAARSSGVAVARARRRAAETSPSTRRGCLVAAACVAKVAAVGAARGRARDARAARPHHAAAAA